MQLQKSQEQHQKIPKSVVVQHKIGAPWYVLKIEPNMIWKINWHDSFYIFSNFKISLNRVKSFLLLYTFAWCKNCHWRVVDSEAAEIYAWCKWLIILFEVICLCIYVSSVVQNSKQNRHLYERYSTQASNTDTEVANIKKRI